MTTLSNISVDSPFIPHIPTPDVGFTSPAPDAAVATWVWCGVAGWLGGRGVGGEMREMRGGGMYGGVCV